MVTRRVSLQCMSPDLWPTPSVVGIRPARTLSRGKLSSMPVERHESDPQATSTINGSIPPELPQPCAKKIGCTLDDRRIGVGAVTCMDRRHGGRVFARGDGAGNFEFQGVVRQHKEAGAETGGSFAGISDMDPRSFLVPSGPMAHRRRASRPRPRLRRPCSSSAPTTLSQNTRTLPCCFWPRDEDRVIFREAKLGLVCVSARARAQSAASFWI